MTKHEMLMLFVMASRLGVPFAAICEMLVVHCDETTSLGRAVNCLVDHVFGEGDGPSLLAQDVVDLFEKL